MGVVVPTPTLLVLVLLIFPLPSAVVHCAFTVNGCSKQIAKTNKVAKVKP